MSLPNTCSLLQLCLQHTGCLINVVLIPITTLPQKISYYVCLMDKSKLLQKVKKGMIILESFKI